MQQSLRTVRLQLVSANFFSKGPDGTSSSSEGLMVHHDYPCSHDNAKAARAERKWLIVAVFQQHFIYECCIFNFI